MGSNLPDKVVFLVDDDPDFLHQQRLLLEGAGFRVVTAESQSQAELLLQDFRPDLAILDLMMEHMDGGFVLCHHLKKKHPEIPVILVSGVARETGFEFDAATEEERSWLKADAVLAKPVRFEQLRREIDRLLKEKDNGNATSTGR